MNKLLSLLCIGMLCVTNLFSAVTPLETEAYAKNIDNILNQEYVEYKLQPNGIINDDQFVRRAYLTIIGRIPTLKEYQNWNSIHTNNKRELLVSHLVNTPGYVSNMYNFWADLLRLRERLSGQTNGIMYIQWIKDEIEKNTRYDQFVKELLTSQGSYYDVPQTGIFLRDTGMPADNLIANLKVFNGTDISCAQCHDHPFSEWTQKQFLQTEAMFFQTQEINGRKNPQVKEKVKQLREEAEKIVAENPEEKKKGLNFQIANFLGNALTSVEIEPTKKLTFPFDYRYKDAKPNEIVSGAVPYGKQEITHKDDMREDFVEWLIAPTNDKFAKTIVNRYWNLVFGRPIIQNMNNIFDSDKINDKLLTKLSDIFINIGYDSKAMLTILCNTQLFQRASYVKDIKGDNYVFIGPVLHRISSESVWDSIISLVEIDPEYFRLKDFTNSYRDAMKIDPDTISTLTLNDVKEKIVSLAEANRHKFINSKQFNNLYLVRASEINFDGPNDIILKELGKSSRELIGSNSVSGSVTQIINLIGGPITKIATMPDSSLKKELKNKTKEEQTEIIFEAILSRKSTLFERSLFIKVDNVDDLIWSLINCQEFKFM